MPFVLHTPAPDTFGFLDRFVAKIDVDPTTGCWLWNASIMPKDGYASFSFEGRTVRGHIYSHRHLFGQIDQKVYDRDHLCRVRHCVNPHHLEVVTKRENTLRGVSGAAQNAAKTHCVRGHAFTDENTYVYIRDGWQHRGCRACKRTRQNAYAQAARFDAAQIPLELS